MANNNLYKVERTALPDDTKKAIGEERVDNFALLFNKMAHFAEKENIDGNDGNIENLLGREIKAHFYHRSKIKGQNGVNHLDLTREWRFSDSFEKYYKAFLEGHAAAAKALFSSHVDLILKADWRIAIGMGNESVYENGFTFHPTYGIPYLPGSSLKGVTRHWAIGEEKDKEGKDKDGKNDYLKIFGNEQHENKNFHQGQIIFFDAFPVELKEGSLQPDIMNNHYPEYYEGKKPPADWLSPRPIFFLAMKEVAFQFHLGCILPPGGNPEGLLNTVKDWLVKALKESGVGAKTAVGYGRMGRGNASKSNRRKVDEKQSEEENEGEQPEPGAIKPTFQPGESSKKLKNDIVFDAVVTEEGKPCLADIYGYGDRLHKQKPVSGSVQNLKKGDVILVSIQTNGKKGSKIISATYMGNKKA